MRRTAFVHIFAIAVTAIVALAPRTAGANKLDLAVGRFVNCTDNGYCWADNAAYEQFLAEYFFALSPKLLAPADTLGYSGFYLGLESTLVPITGDATFSTNTADSSPWYKGTGPANDNVRAMFVPTIHVRKGLPWSIELGGSLTYLAQSEVLGIGGEIKWSLFEGYLTGARRFFPNIALRGTVMRVIGTTDLDVTIVGADASISRPFPIGGQISLTPYGGYQYIWTIIRTEPIVYRDDTGFHEASGERWDTTMLSGPNLGRSKVFAGMRLKYELLALTVEGGFGLPQTWDTAIEREVSDGGAFEAQKETDVKFQFQLSFAAGMDF